MLDQLHELDLLEHLRLRGLVQLLLVDDLDRHLLTGEHVTGQLDHRIMTFTYKAGESKVTGEKIVPLIFQNKNLKKFKKGQNLIRI